MPDGRPQRLEFGDVGSVRVEAEVIAVQADSVFAVLDGDLDVAIRAPKISGAAIGLRRRAIVRMDTTPPTFVKWLRVGEDQLGDPGDVSLPQPPPPGCVPPGQPLPTGLGLGQSNALKRLIEHVCDGRLPNTRENDGAYMALAYLIRRAEGQGIARANRANKD